MTQSRTAKLDLSKIGIIFSSDPAQLLPIGGAPFWSVKKRRTDNRNYSESSLQAINDFRGAFRMPKLSDVPGFNLFKKNELDKKPSLAQRMQMSQFTFKAYITMKCDVIYLTDVKRTFADDELCQIHQEIMERTRFGKWNDQDLLQLKEISATKDEMENDLEFKQAFIVEDRHFFNPDTPYQKTVESENIRRTFDFAEKYNKPIVHLQSIHTPIEHESVLAAAPGREFASLLKHLVACQDLPMLLLTNIAPHFGLYNGATLYFHGLWYCPDDADITVTKEDFHKIKLNEMKVIRPFDLNVQGSASYSRFHQLPKDSTLLHIDGFSVTSTEEIDKTIEGKQSFTCRFKLPNSPPALPDFIVLRSVERTSSCAWICNSCSVSRKSSKTQLHSR